MEIQKTLNSQSNLEKEEWNWKNQPAWLQALLQSHSLQDSMALAQRKKYTSVEQNRKPRDKSTHLWTPYGEGDGTPVLLLGKSHGWRSLVGCTPWGREELDITEQLHFHFHFPLSCIGEGNGNPPQCSCLENPRDGGAWWAAIYGVAQSRTRLKWLSS